MYLLVFVNLTDSLSFNFTCCTLVVSFCQRSSMCELSQKDKYSDIIFGFWTKSAFKEMAKLRNSWLSTMQLVSILAIFILTILSTNNRNLVSCAKINSDGGYEISLAVKSGEEKDDRYLTSLKDIISAFSIQLFRSTNGKFYIKSADILVPSAWNTESFVDEVYATSQSFHAADIRISDKYSEPHTENSHLCGVIGNYIELPLTFFETLNESPYGQQAKVLVTQWARYRWGVWEEHGFPSSEKFPYFHKHAGSNKWEATGCSDEPIIGEFVDKYNEVTLCDPDSDEPLPNDCRFKPSTYKNNATCSLMHFHFLDTVTKFCDKTHHNKMSPNKQNLFCGFRSVWEVIESTTDYAAAHEPISDVPLVKFNLIKEQSNPILYVLLDKGMPQFPAMVNKINNQLVKLFDRAEMSNIFASLGTFPTLPSSSLSSRVTEQVGWSTISSNKNAFQNAVLLPSNRDINRDFGLAILEAAELIRRKDSPGGAVLVIVKNGAGNGSYGNLVYEKEVYGSLINQKIRVLALELKGENWHPFLNLGSLVSSSSLNGVHAIVNSTNIDNSATFENFFVSVANALADPIPEPPEPTSVIFKGLIPVDNRFSIFVKPNLERLNFYVTVPADAEIYFEINPGGVQGTIPEWDEKVDGSRRSIRYGYFNPSVDMIENGGEWKIKYTCESNCENANQGNLFITGTHASSPRDNDTFVEPTVSVFSSAIDGIVDFNVTKDRNSPFTIFAKVNIGTQPVSGLKIVAHVSSIVAANGNWTLSLVDDGRGSPDIDSDDGIYSGTFIPNMDGTYKISLQVINDNINTIGIVNRVDARLLPVDQTQFGCSDDDADKCGAVNLTKFYESTVDMVETVTVKNLQTFRPGKPTPIIDLTITERPGEVLLHFKAPTFIGLVGLANKRYHVYVAKELEHILENRDDHELVQDIIYRDVGLPGQDEELIISASETTFSGTIWLTITASNLDTNHESDILRILPATLEGETATEPGQTTVPSETDGPTTDSTTEVSTTGEPEESKSFWKKTEGIITIIVIVIVVLALLGGGVWYCYRDAIKTGKYSTSRRQKQPPPPPFELPPSEQSPSTT